MKIIRSFWRCLGELTMAIQRFTRKASDCLGRWAFKPNERGYVTITHRGSCTDSTPARPQGKNPRYPENHEEEIREIEESFRRGWKEVMSGQTIPLSKLWEEFEDE